jgi:hypothetical protein
LERTWTADDSIGVPFERPTFATKRFLTEAEPAELEPRSQGRRERHHPHLSP